jgi:hypothetical protein
MDLVQIGQRAEFGRQVADFPIGPKSPSIE